MEKTETNSKMKRASSWVAELVHHNQITVGYHTGCASANLEPWSVIKIGVHEVIMEPMHPNISAKTRKLLISAPVHVMCIMQYFIRKCSKYLSVLSSDNYSQEEISWFGLRASPENIMGEAFIKKKKPGWCGCKRGGGGAMKGIYWWRVVFRQRVVGVCAYMCGGFSRQ